MAAAPQCQYPRRRSAPVARRRAQHCLRLRYDADGDDEDE